MDPDKKTVVYVPTSMDGTIRAAPYRARSPGRMFDLERRIVETLAEFQSINSVVKLPRPVREPCSPIAEFIRDRQWKHINVVTDPFQTVLPAADLFVTDYPSTSFLEMLTTDRPILVCGAELPQKFNRETWHPAVLDMWKERVAYADDLDEFLGLLRTYLREERFEPVHSKNTLLKLFGTHIDDGKSAERAYEFILSLANRQRTRGDESVTTVPR